MWLHSKFCEAAVIAVVQVLLVTAPAGAADKASQIAELLQKYHDYGLFNGSALVAEGGSIVYKQGYGLANLEWHIPNQPDTKFRIGSLTKPFTALLVLQLVSEGKLRLEGTVADYLPYYRADVAERVTLHHLLTHTSGMGESTYQGPEDIRRDPYQPRDFIENYLTGDLDFEPGSHYSYSNLGYFVLGAILEEVTGESYEALVQERIFSRAGMKNSGYDRHATILPARAAGYRVSVGGIKNAPYIDTSLPYAAGALYSTVEDLYLWDQALYSEKLLSDAWKQKYFTPFKDNYAYGWLVAKESLGPSIGERTFMAHGGTISGFTARLTRVVEDRNLIALLSNGDNAPLGAITSGVIRILYGFPVKFPKQPLAEVLLRTINERGVEAAVEEYQGFKGSQSDLHNFGEQELERLGRFLLEEKRLSEALVVFRLNAEAYPESFRVYESLGDTHDARGEAELAREMFEKSLGLNPSNTHALERLKNLRPGPVER